MAIELNEIKLQVAQANRVLSNAGLASGVTSALGRASMRMPSQPDRFVVKGREYPLDALAFMRPEDMVVCDTEGFLVGGPSGITHCSEVKIHSCIYKTSPDVQSVVHVHARFIVLLSVLDIPLLPMCQEGIHLVRHRLPVYSTPTSRRFRATQKAWRWLDCWALGAPSFSRAMGRSPQATIWPKRSPPCSNSKSRRG